MMRIFKHYHFNVKDAATAAKSLSFSSYAGSVVICVTSFCTCRHFSTVVTLRIDSNVISLSDIVCLLCDVY